ncbi:MAG: hypothetical protein KKA67_01065 [Spirochaetes bacterium]|nr:hypothetical protein [Spirochaetota bacterium]MBU1081264.1 hypothetical protein [Spirochaetota bacterium]
MFVPVFLAAVAAVLFYVLLPVAGAFVVRHQWRQFRKAVVDSSRLPGLGEALGQAPGEAGSGQSDGELGRCRVQGEVDAIGGQHELWISGHGAACVVELKDAWVYTLTGRAGEDAIARLRWSSLPSIGPGARAFVAGSATLRGGRLAIGARGKEAPLVVLHDGDDDEVVRRSVWAGRHDNEYWNPTTQVSLALGAAAMSAILPSALSGKVPSLVGALTITVAFSPILALLPPGVVGFFLYRRYWKRARYCRARRDTEALEHGNEELKRAWRKRAYGATTASALAMASALAVNGWLLIFALRRFL